jgi:uncharacterized protein (DUF427 family)
MKRAMWNGVVIAESPAIQIVDGYPYFPPDAVKWDRLRAATHTSVCGWKGTARYYDVVIDGAINENAAWVYETPRPAAAHIAGHIGFWHGVTVD